MSGLAPCWRVAGAAVVVLAGCASVHLGAPRDCEAPDEPMPASAPEADLRLISWNVHGIPTVSVMDKRIVRIANVIRERRPDIVFLQEVWFKWDARAFASALGPDYAYLDDPPALTDTFLYRAVGFRRGGLLTFWRTGRGIVVDDLQSGFVPFANGCSGCPLLQGDTLSHKGVQKTAMTLQGTETAMALQGTELVLLNTHLQSQYPEAGQAYELVRSQQIDDLVNRVKSIRGAILVVVAGDFNTTFRGSDEWLYRRLTAGLRDMTEPFRSSCCSSIGQSAGWSCLCATQVTGNGAPAEWIDYVLVRPHAELDARATDMNLIRSQSEDCPYSDHNGLEVGLTVRRR